MSNSCIEINQTTIVITCSGSLAGPHQTASISNAHVVFSYHHRHIYIATNMGDTLSGWFTLFSTNCGIPTCTLACIGMCMYYIQVQHVHNVWI